MTFDEWKCRNEDDDSYRCDPHGLMIPCRICSYEAAEALAERAREERASS